MVAEQLINELVAIDSPKQLNQMVERNVQATDKEVGLTLLEIGNVRAEQAKRERDPERERRWRRVQTEVQMRPFDFQLTMLLLRKDAGEDAVPAAIDQLSKLGQADIERLAKAGEEQVRIVQTIAQGTLSASDGQGQLPKTLDPLALVLTVGLLQGRLIEVTAGRASGAGWAGAVEVLAKLAPPSTDPSVAAGLFDMVRMLYCLESDNTRGVGWLERAAAVARRGNRRGSSAER